MYPLVRFSCVISRGEVPAAAKFYQKAFGFAKRAIMNGPDGQPMHAELTLRGAILMLGPENSAMGKRTAKSLGGSPAGLFLYVENADKVVAKATSLGAAPNGSRDGHVLGGSRRQHCGSGWIQLDDRDPQNGAFGQGNEKEHEGRQANRFWGLNYALQPRAQAILGRAFRHIPVE